MWRHKAERVPSHESSSIPFWMHARGGFGRFLVSRRLPLLWTGQDSGLFLGWIERRPAAAREHSQAVSSHIEMGGVKLAKGVELELQILPYQNKNKIIFNVRHSFLYSKSACRNNKLVLSAWCAYIQVLPTISLYALIKRHALKIGSHLTIQSIVNNNQNALPLSPPLSPTAIWETMILQVYLPALSQNYTNWRTCKTMLTIITHTLNEKVSMHI